MNSGEKSRRKVLKSIGVTATTGVALGGTIGTSTAKSESDSVERISGEDRDKYVKQAFSEVTSSDKYREFITRVSRRGYSIDMDGALVTRHVDDGITNVLLPLTDEQNRMSIDAITDYGEGANFGHVLWKSDSSDATALIAGDADVLTDGLSFVSDASIPNDGVGVEVIGPDSHDIEISTEINGRTAKPSNSLQPLDTEAGVTFAHIDATAERIETQQPILRTSTPQPARTTCPDSIPVILGAISTCGAACSTCSSVSLGNLPALFTCLGCAACGCGLGCCLGERSSAACAYASTVRSAPFFFSPAVVAGAACVNERCNNNSCF